MTIAAGFKVRDGILLCADTEFSGGVKLHKEKISRHHFSGGLMAFVVSGNETNAEMAIRDCHYGLRPDGPHYTSEQVESVFRTAVESIYDRYVERAPEKEKDAAQFDLIAGVFFHGHEPYILASDYRGVKLINDFVCRGSGWPLADYIIRRSYETGPMSLEQVAIVALQFLSATKLHCEGVSGPSQFVTMNRYSVTDTITGNFGIAEEQIRQYEQATGRLLIGIGNTALEAAAIERNIDAFVSDVRAIHTAWKADASGFSDFLKRLTS